MEEDYSHLKREIDYLNINFFGLLSHFGLSEDLDTMLKALEGGKRFLKSVFIDKVTMDVYSGKIPKEKYLSPKCIIDFESLAPEEREKAKKRERRNLHRALTFLFNKLYKEYADENKLYYIEPRYNRRAIEICRKALYLTPSQIAIDVDKFIEIYKSYLAADESITKKMHQEAADALNKFFNGLTITHKELSKYFILEYGIVRVNPKSINLEDYSRLGKRTITITKLDKKRKR